MRIDLVLCKNDIFVLYEEYVRILDWSFKQFKEDILDSARESQLMKAMQDLADLANLSKLAHRHGELTAVIEVPDDAY